MKKEIYEKIYQIHNNLVDDFSSIHAKMREFYRNSKGELWTKEELETLQKENRPSPEYALIEPIRNSLIGTERMSRASMRVVPYKDNENGEIAHALTQALLYNYNRSWYNWYKSKQFIHVITTGIGFSADWWDKARRHWRFKPIDPLRVYFDKSTREATFEDCRYVQTVEYLTAEEIISLTNDEEVKIEIIKRFKHFEPELSNKMYDKLNQLGYDFAELGGLDAKYSIGNINVSAADRDISNGRYKVIEHHEKRVEEKVLLIDEESKNSYDVTDVKATTIRKFLEQNKNFKKVVISEDKFYITIICPTINMVISDKPYPYKATSFMIKPQVAYDVAPHIINTYSVLENPLKINKAFNKKKAVELEYAINTIGGDWIADESSVSGLEEQWQTRKKIGLRVYRAGTPPPRRDQPSTPPATLFQAEAKELNLFDIITPVSKPYRGLQEGSNETGVLFSYKVKQNEIMLQHLFDNATLSQYLDAKSCMEQTIAFMDDETWQRLLPEKDWELIDQIRSEEFEVELDQSKPTVTARQYGFSQLIQLLPYIPPQLIRFDTVIEASDIPNKEELADFIREQYKKQGMLEKMSENQMNAVANVTTQQPTGQPVMEEPPAEQMPEEEQTTFPTTI